MWCRRRQNDEIVPEKQRWCRVLHKTAKGCSSSPKNICKIGEFLHLDNPETYTGHIFGDRQQLYELKLGHQLLLWSKKTFQLEIWKHCFEIHWKIKIEDIRCHEDNYGAITTTLFLATNPNSSTCNITSWLNWKRRNWEKELQFCEL